MLKRTPTRTVSIGKLAIGAKHPIRIKGMLKTPLAETKKLIAEAKLLQAEGAEAIRVAVKEEKDAGIARILKKHVQVPLVADIHFIYTAALRAIEEGFDSIRLNPLNLRDPRKVKEIVSLAKANHVSIRVGVNSGGFKRIFPTPQAHAAAMIQEAGMYIKILEKAGFFDIMVSLKGSDVLTTIEANRLFRKKFEYPLHLGVTATGSYRDGLIKSAIGLGQLLSEGIGDVIRISLTAEAVEEIRAAKSILQALRLRAFGPEIISCPTCSRCQAPLIEITERFRARLAKIGFKKPITIAIMGCAVNGPGEAYQADIGAAFGTTHAVIFRKDTIIRRTTYTGLVNGLITEIQKLWT